MLKGLLAGGITMSIAAVFPESLVYPFFVGVLGFSAGVFSGLAMAPSTGSRPGLEWTVALLILGLGLVGLWASPLLLAAAWVAHGAWAFLHRFTGMGKEIPEGVPGFCLSFSLVLGAFVIYMWGMEG